MKFAVVGAGAVGCYFGAMLARAGHDVVLIGRREHVEAIRKEGLRISTAAFDEHVRLDASTDLEAVRGRDVVLFCVKSQDTESTGRALAGLLAPGATVLTLQNGVDNAERLRAVIHNPVAAVVVYVATEMAGPGWVKHHGRGDLVLEPSARSEEIAQAFAASAVPAHTSENVRGELWAKLIINCAYNGLSAIANQPYGRLVQNDGIPETMQAIVAECVAVARADGVQIPGDIEAAVRNIAVAMPGQYSSTAQDFARGKPTEIDYLNGLIVRRGKSLGVATPVNQTIWALLKTLERTTKSQTKLV